MSEVAVVNMTVANRTVRVVTSGAACRALYQNGTYQCCQHLPTEADEARQCAEERAAPASRRRSCNITVLAEKYLDRTALRICLA